MALAGTGEETRGRGFYRVGMDLAWTLSERYNSGYLLEGHSAPTFKIAVTHQGYRSLQYICDRRHLIWTLPGGQERVVPMIDA